MKLSSRRDFFRVAGACAAGAYLLGTDALADDRESALWVHEAMFTETLDEKRIRCTLCPRECVVADMERGSCGVRENRSGKYYTLVYGRPCSIHVDPVEKKPLFHYRPGTQAFSIATAGCNIECKFCQNWDISQFRPEQVRAYELSPTDTARAAKRAGAASIAYTYSEPVIFYEYMHDTAVAARPLGVESVMISNGYINPAPMRKLAKVLDAVKVDLKAFTEKFYREVCSGELKPVLDTLVLLKELGMWTEIVVLIVPGLNDSAEEIRGLSRWVRKNLGPDVPVHFTRFSPNYKMKNLPPTPVKTLERSWKIGREEGLNYVYLGNVVGHKGENTYCPSCGKTLIRRIGFSIVANEMRDGACSKCDTKIAGVW